MSLQFSRSLRSLSIDGYRAARIGLILAVVNILLLLAWFFFARITLYETSSEVRWTQDNRLEATFSTEGIARIHPGQPARLRIDAGPDQALITAPAIVIGADRNSKNAQFLLMSNDLSQDQAGGDLREKAAIDVEIEYVNPVTLVLRAAGKYLGGGNTPVSPQRPPEREGG